MIKCNAGCYPVCDFCIHLRRDEDRFSGVGFCTKHGGKEMDLADRCDDFHCFNVAGEAAADAQGPKDRRKGDGA